MAPDNEVEHGTTLLLTQGVAFGITDEFGDTEISTSAALTTPIDKETTNDANNALLKICLDIFKYEFFIFTIPLLIKKTL
jgi:hypothetical protein